MISKFSLPSLLEELNKAAEAAGTPNISYCASIDLGDAFPAVIQLGLLAEESDEECYPDNVLLDTLRFLAQNGRFFPESLCGASLEEFQEHLVKNADKIFGEIQHDIKCYLGEYSEKSHAPSCPDCESDDTEMGFNGRYHCNRCDRLFDDEDIRREELRHTLSPMLSETSEEDPLQTDVAVEELGPSVIDRLFLFEDGTIWYGIRGEAEYRDIDTLSVDALEKIIETIQ